MFLHLSISHSVHRGEVCIPACTGADTPGQTYPSMHWGRHPPGQTYPSMHWGRHTPGQTYPSMHWGRHPPPPMATAADSTHPTGMHSCSQRCCTKIKSKFNKKSSKVSACKTLLHLKRSIKKLELSRGEKTLSFVSKHITNFSAAILFCQEIVK